MIGFVGCGAALYPRLYNSNGYFKLENDLFLLDCGETSFRQHYMAGNLKNIENITVFLTHMHADHLGSLGTLIVYGYLKLGIRTRVIFPDAENLALVLRLTGVEKEHYELFANYGACGDVRLNAEPVPVKHHESMVKSFGWLLSFEGRRIYYSGDAGEFPGIVRDKLLSGQLDEVYQDTSVNDHGGAHCTLAQLEALVPAEHRNKVYCMHYDGEYFDMIREKGFRTVENAIPTEICY